MGAFREGSIQERIALAQIMFGDIDPDLRIRFMLRDMRWRWARASRGTFLATVNAYSKLV